MEAIFKILILSAITLFFVYLVFTGKVLFYVHPRIIPYIKFAILTMIFLILTIVPDIFHPRRKSKGKEYVFFLIPIVFALAIPAKAMDSSSMSFNDIEANTVTSGTQKTKNLSNGIDKAGSVQSSNSNDNSSSAADKFQVENGLVIVDDTIVMTDVNFVKWVTEISTNMDKYKGKKIRLVGSVFKSEDFTKNEFVPARLMMTCCTADLQPVGFLCRYNAAELLQKDTWVMVNGTIDIVNYKGQNMPVIEAEQVDKAEKPKADYVYPY
ncbi:TIGR03943 family protein [Clostridium manihotivorum]|uniref:TIGR03943 family protein n=2 Tax=Clostridium manihotivorum TaxID=2320868 RepID=A0A3R5U908_9CLOT|nr:TIGR03943 family protein [Clostridium manihotivorum]